MPFSDPLVAGTILIREAIRSPNYAAGSAGWTINADGTAEFNNITARGTVYVSGDDGAYITIATFAGTPFQYLNPGPPASATPVDEPAALFASTSAFVGGYVAYTELSSPILQAGYASRIRVLGSADNGGADPYVIIDSNSGAHPVTLWVIGAQRLTGPGDLTMDGDLVVGGDLTVTGTAKVPMPVCRARDNTGGQSLTSSAWTAITLDTDTTDLPGWHSTSSNTARITPSVPCRALVWGGVAFGGSTLGARRGCAVGLNGTTPLLGTAQLMPNTGTAVNLGVGSIPTVVDFNGSTDYVQVLAWTEGGAGQTTTVDATRGLASSLAVEVIELL